MTQPPTSRDRVVASMTVDARGTPLEGQCRDINLPWGPINRELAAVVSEARQTGLILELGTLREVQVHTGTCSLRARCTPSGGFTSIATVVGRWPGRREESRG